MATSNGSGAAATPAVVRALLDMLAGTDVEELELEIRGARVLIRRDPALAPSDGPRRSEALAPAEEGLAESSVEVVSTLVGVFLRGREPGAEPLARAGDHVAAGQPLAIIESLRVPHPVEAPVAGVLEEVLVDDGHPVEYGQVVMRIRPLG